MGWKGELKKSVKTLSVLEKTIPLSTSEKEWFKKNYTSRLPLFICQSFFKKIERDKTNFSNPIRLQSIPRIEETFVSEDEAADPLNEKSFSPIPGLVHRYENRVLLYASHSCAHNCRHCFRGAIAHGGKNIFDHLDEIEDYIVAKEKICEVLLSGADPLINGDKKLELILKMIKRARAKSGRPIVVRICTRTLFTLPSRITNNLLRLLKKYRPIWFVVQINHAQEISPASVKAIKKIQKASFPIVSQTVLLKGINDSVETLKNLMNQLLVLGIKPYYLFQGDLAMGTKHFRVSLHDGLAITAKLRKTVSGLALPNYCVDLPHGGGKIPLQESYFCNEDEKAYYFVNPENKIYGYPKE